MPTLGATERPSSPPAPNGVGAKRRGLTATRGARQSRDVMVRIVVIALPSLDCGAHHASLAEAVVPVRIPHNQVID
jgi:hypothetical protein